MEKKGKSTFVLVSILVLATLAGFFVYPGNAVSEKLPWKLGLDLVGGSALIYEVDLSNIEPSGYEDAVAGLKDVVERRINIFGVAEPRVTTAKKGDSYQLLVELAGVDEDDAASQIGATPVLEFMTVELGPDEEIVYVPTQLTGRYLDSASLDFDPYSQESVVVLQFNEEGARIFLKEVSDPERFGVAELSQELVVGIEEKPKKPKTNLAVTGAYVYDSSVYDIIKNLKPSSRGELEITEVNNHYIKKGSMSYEMAKGFWTDAGTIESLYHASTLVRAKKRGDK